MTVKIYDYADDVTEITLPDKEIREIFVHVISGDETGWIEFTDGTQLDFDASDCRIMGFDDGAYTVTGEDIPKWINYIPQGSGTVSYDRMSEFGYGG